MTTGRAGRRLQQGLGTLGSLIVIALAAVAAYYIYLGVSGEDAAPSCKGELEKCMQRCRKTTTDTTAAQACQAGCRREAHLCEGFKR
ncbi:MAG: hypothetical protein AMJ64_09835 [Betaproteobacteria bacterium SG8_39]|nr:MAG: hypothetical protein AMJ64_09835 [Betaproteobacteria bacterium SG8_39]